MQRNRYSGVPRKSTKDEFSPFTESMTVKLTKTMRRKVEDFARSEHISLTTILQRALVNELNCKEPFKYNTERSTGDKYDDNIHSLDASKIVDYLVRYPGLSLEHLLMVRDEIGDNFTQDYFLICFWQLIDDKVIIEKKATESLYRTYQGYIVNPYSPDVTNHLRGVL